LAPCRKQRGNEADSRRKRSLNVSFLALPRRERIKVRVGANHTALTPALSRKAGEGADRREVMKLLKTNQ